MAAESPEIDDPAFLTALVTEHFVLQTARSIGTGEATSRGALYVATLSSGLVATGFASGKPYFAPILAGVIVVVLLLGLVTFARLVEISREDIQRLRDIHIVHHYYRSLSPHARAYFKSIDVDDVSVVIETEYQRHSPWLILTSAASLVAILNAVVFAPAWPRSPALSPADFTRGTSPSPSLAQRPWAAHPAIRVPHPERGRRAIGPGKRSDPCRAVAA